MTINIINIYYKHNINIFFLFYGIRIVRELGDFTLFIIYNKNKKKNAWHFYIDCHSYQ